MKPLRNADAAEARPNNDTAHEVDLQRLEVRYAIVEVTRLMRAALDERMRALGLSGATWRIIGRLAKQDGLTQAGLARRLEITPVAVGEAVDRLEKSGHVERRPDPKDRRKRRVHLTKKSVALIPHMMEIADVLQAECFDGVSEEDRAVFERTVLQLRERLLEMKIEAADEDGAP